MSEVGPETGMMPVEPVSREAFRQAITDVAVEFAGAQTTLLRPGMVANKRSQEEQARRGYYAGLASVVFQEGYAYSLKTGLELLGQKSLVQTALVDATRVSALADTPLEADIGEKYSLQVNYPLNHGFFEEMIRQVGHRLQMVDQVLADPELSVAVVGTNSKGLVERKEQEGRAKGYTTVLEKLEQGWVIVEAAEAAEKVMRNAKK